VGYYGVSIRVDFLSLALIFFMWATTVRSGLPRVLHAMSMSLSREKTCPGLWINVFKILNSYRDRSMGLPCVILLRDSSILIYSVLVSFHGRAVLLNTA
jgi:hypothetical protein